MGKQDQGSAAAEGTRRATGGAADRRPWGAVLGQAQARDSAASRAVGITAARASHWRAQFLAAGQAGLKSRATDARDEDHRRLQAKIRPPTAQFTFTDLHGLDWEDVHDAPTFAELWPTLRAPSWLWPGQRSLRASLPSALPGAPCVRGVSRPRRAIR